MELNEFRKKQAILIGLSSIVITCIISFSFSLINVRDIIFIFVVTAIAQSVCAYITINDLVRGSQPAEDGEVDYESTEVNSSNVSEDKYFYFPYINGFAIVLKETFHYDGHSEKSYSFINKKGEYITQKWYCDVMDFNEYGVAIVYDGAAYNIIDNNGKELSMTWFHSIVPFSDGVAKVRWIDGSVNYIDATGNLIWSEWKEDTPSLISVIENKNIEES